MRVLFSGVVLALALLVASPVMAQDLRTPREAYNRGDYATALREWRPLAEQGNMTAQSFIGMMYLNGNGVPQDYAEAVKWSRKAAAHGDIPAMYNLGGMYKSGLGVPQDYAKALGFYRRTAAVGFYDAWNDLGGMYARGQGVLQDNVIARMWFNLAASKGNEGAVESRDLIAKQMTAASIEEAQRLARECLARIRKNCGR